MVALTIKHNFPEVQRQLKRLSDDVAKAATVRAVNRTVEAARTDMNREIRKTYNVSASYVRERLTIRRASFKASRFAIEAALSGGSDKKRSANLIAFLEKSVSLVQGRKRMKKEKTKRPQLRFQIKRKGGKQVITGAFVGNKGRTVFKRTGKERLPIEAVQTIDVAQMFNAKAINNAVTRAMLRKFPEIWAREVRYYTEKFGKG